MYVCMYVCMYVTLWIQISFVIFRHNEEKTYKIQFLQSLLLHSHTQSFKLACTHNRLLFKINSYKLNAKTIWIITTRIFNVKSININVLPDICKRERERNVLFNDAINTFYLRLYGVRHMVKDHSDSEKGNIGYSYRLTARVLLYAPSHRQDNTYHGLWYTSCGALAGTRNSSMGPPHEGSIRRPIAPWANALPLSYVPLPDICNVPITWTCQCGSSTCIYKPILFFAE